MNRSYINTASFADFLSKKTKFVLIVFFVLIQTAVLGQSVGDYRSATTGNWTTLSSWQYYNGTTWITPSGTSPQGYPGQFVGTGAVLIQANHTISLSATITTISFGTLTITGTLNLNGDNSAGGMDFNLATQGIIVTPSSGFIGFAQKVNLRLPSTAGLQVSSGGLDNSKPCTANQIIYIGVDAYSKCTGGGLLPDFGDLMDQGGTLIANPTSNSPVCQFNPINLIGDYTGVEGTTTSGGTTNGVNYAWSVQAPDATILTSNTKDYNFTANQSGVYSATLTCSTYFDTTLFTNSKTISVVVNVLPTTPTIGTITQPTCTVPTGTITVTAPTGMNYSIDGLTYTNTTGIFTSLAPGTYSVTAKNSSGCISNATSVTITSPNKTWNGSVSSDWNTAANWTPVGIPNDTNCIIIPDVNGSNYDPIISGPNYNAYGYSLTVLNSGSLTVEATNTITVTDFVNVGLGFLTFEDTSSLVQINNAANSGYVDYIRTTTARPTDYTYLSSPVAPMTLGELYPVGSSFYSYEATSSTEDWKQETAGTEMIAGKGYIANQGAVIPSPGSPPPPDLLEFTFTGVPNNGSISIPGVFADKSCLLGNPYPSALDADAFLVANSGVLNGTLYFWTHNTTIGTNVPNPGSGVYAYSSNDYATYNATGGVGAAPSDSGTTTSAAPSGGSIPTGKIGAGQGFFASTKTSLSGTSIVFNNTMRIAGNNSQFFKKRNSKTEKIIEKNRIWLNLTNTQGAFKQTLVGYITGATNDYDDRFDGESFDGNEFVDFYSLNQDKNLVIQGRALPFDENDEILLGYRSTINGDFTINIDQTDGLLTNQAVFLEDKLTQMVFDLKSGNYTFNTVAGTFNDRFVLRYKDNSTAKTLGKPTVDTIENKVLVSNKNKQIKINSNSETIDKVMVYDVSGKLMYKKEKANSQEVIISNLTAKNQVLIVKTTLQNGKTVTDKIVN